MEKLQLDESTFSVDRKFLRIDSQSIISLLLREEVEELIKYLQDNLENLKR
jgi:hypothetical protein